MPARTRRSVDHRVMSAPSNITRPPRAGISPMTVLSNVVLPTPLRPMRQTTLFAGTVRSTPHSTCDSPYVASTRSTVSMNVFPLPEVHLEHARIGLHLVDRALAQHGALMEHRHLARDLADELHVVLDHEHRAVGGDRLEQFARARGFLVGHAGHGLVHEQELGIL